LKYNPTWVAMQAFSPNSGLIGRTPVSRTTFGSGSDYANIPAAESELAAITVAIPCHHPHANFPL
jgi:hypothetical protein